MIVGVVEVVFVDGGPVGGRDADAEFLENAIVEEGVEVLRGEAGGGQERRRRGSGARGERAGTWAPPCVGSGLAGSSRQGGRGVTGTRGGRFGMVEDWNGRMAR
jgi:hypothetical protein